jgi:hypothetical protein
MAVLLTLNLSCAQPGERHHLNLTTARPFLTLVEIVAAIDFLGVLDGVWDRFLQQPPSDAHAETFCELRSKVRAPAAACPVETEKRGRPRGCGVPDLSHYKRQYRFRPDDDFELRRRGRPHFLAAIPRSL